MSTKMKRTNVMDGMYVSLPLVYNDNSETSAKFEIPVGMVLDPNFMWLIVDTLDSTETITVGILSTEAGGNAAGFINGYSIATAGTYRVADMYTCTDGSSQNYISANYIGAFFFGGLAGGNAADTSGIMALKSHRGDGTAKTISYTCSAGSDSFVGRLVFIPRILPL